MWNILTPSEEMTMQPFIEAMQSYSDLDQAPQNGFQVRDDVVAQNKHYSPNMIIG
jgi:hypothetical protein